MNNTMIKKEKIEENYEFPLYTPTYDDPYWEHNQHVIKEEDIEFDLPQSSDDEEEDQQPHTPLHQIIAQSDWSSRCPSPPSRSKRVIVRIGTERMAMTNLRYEPPIRSAIVPRQLVYRIPFRVVSLTLLSLCSQLLPETIVNHHNTAIPFKEEPSSSLSPLENPIDVCDQASLTTTLCVADNSELVTDLILPVIDIASSHDIEEVILNETMVVLEKVKEEVVLNEMPSVPINIISDSPVVGLPKGMMYNKLLREEKDWRDCISRYEVDARTHIFRRRRDNRDWVVLDERHHKRRVQEYTTDQVRDGKRRLLRLSGNHPFQL